MFLIAGHEAEVNLFTYTNTQLFFIRELGTIRLLIAFQNHEIMCAAF